MLACAHGMLAVQSIQERHGIRLSGIFVVEGDRKAPFLRGVVTHSLVERGLSFEEAYDAANLVRDRIRKKKEITKQELWAVIQKVLSEHYGRSALLASKRLKPVPMILVVGAEAMPFSKGILSQSLQASGLDPQHAYAIAQQIQLRLLEERRTEISRDELRRLIYKRIQDKHGDPYAERYLLWRYFKNPDKPLIILFGGATGVGKTSVATEVAHRLGIGQILSTDTVREMMRMMFSREILPTIHTSSFEAWKEMLPDEKPSHAVAVAFREQCIRVIVGVRAMLERAVLENNTLVIEGVHLVPGLLPLEDFEDRAYVIPVVISTLDKSALLQRFPARQSQAQQRTAERYRQNFKSILRIQDFILEHAETEDVPSIENTNLDETISTVLTVITSSLRKKLQISSEELVAKTL